MVMSLRRAFVLLVAELFLLASIALGASGRATSAAYRQRLSGMARFTAALAGAVLVPYVLSRFVLGQDVIRFPLRTGRRWTRTGGPPPASPTTRSRRWPTWPARPSGTTAAPRTWSGRWTATCPPGRP